MKSMIAMCTLLLLAVACGKNTGNGLGMPLDKETAMMDYEEWVRDLKPGFVYESQNVFEGHWFNRTQEIKDDTVYTITIEAAPYRTEYTRRVVLLKVENDKFYTYEVSNSYGQDLAIVYVSNRFFPLIKVIIEDKDARQYQGKILTEGRGEENNADLGQGPELSQQYSWRYEVDRDNYCNIVTERKNFNARIMHNGKMLPVTPRTSTEVGNCGQSLDEDELRALDLSSVRVCYHDIKEGEIWDRQARCENNQDMSHLVR